MAHQLRPVDLSFLSEAPVIEVFCAAVQAPRADVFARISADPSTWSWFPGIANAGYDGDEPHGVGSRRHVHMAGTFYGETMLAWDAPSRWTYRVDETSIPLAHALVEEWAVLDGDDDGASSIVRWTFAIDPKPMFNVARFAGAAVMGALFRRAMANLDRQLRDAAT